MSAHPAKFSSPIVAVMREILLNNYPDWFGRPVLFDPFAGDGSALHALCTDLGWLYSGCEIEASFINAPGIRHGDACDPSMYPPVTHPNETATSGWIVATSPPYGNGLCLAEGERVLTRDLRWVPVGDLEVADELFAFEEEPGLISNGRTARRRYAESMVTHAEPATVECVRVVLADGSEVVTTPEHPWLVRPHAYGSVAPSQRRGPGAGITQWVPSTDLLARDGVGVGLGHRAGAHGNRYALKQFEPWSYADHRLAGWLAGIFDGEGHLTAPIRKTALKLGVCQNRGLVLDAIHHGLADMGFRFGVYDKASTSKVQAIEMQGGLPEIARLLGQVRPMRLLDKFLNIDPSDMVTQPTAVEVVAVEPVGRRDIMKLSTSSRTYIGEGFLMHNSDHAVANDASKRYTYRKAISTIEGVDRELHESNLGRYGYRSTKRDGKSTKRAEYWRIADKIVGNWSSASMVILNVSDFIARGQVEPHVADWKDLLARHGWADQTDHPVGTRRMRNGENAEARVDHEVVIVGRRA
jgi:hypothetical protein